MFREKLTAEERKEAAKACVGGRMSAREAARRLEVNKPRVHEWISRYKAHSVETFRKQEHNTVYSIELKAQAVGIHRGRLLAERNYGKARIVFNSST